jgi:hypothetical protein
VVVYSLLYILICLVISLYLLLSKIFIPSLSLAFEYQGEIHYRTSILHGSAAQRQKIDQAKANYAKDIGVTLIPIPFWWDKSSESLAATIHHYRPDLGSTNTTHPIPHEMPAKYNIKFRYRPSVAQQFDEKMNFTGWYCVLL